MYDVVGATITEQNPPARHRQKYMLKNLLCQLRRISASRQAGQILVTKTEQPR